MPDRRPEPIEHDHGMHASDMAYEQRRKDAADLLAAVRRGVESGTIKGEVQDARLSRREPTVRWSLDAFKGGGTYIVIGPVSDGGSET